MAQGFFAPSTGNSLMPRRPQRPRRPRQPDFDMEQPRGPLTDRGYYQDFSIPGGEDAGDTVARISSAPNRAVPGPEDLALQDLAAQFTGRQEPFSLFDGGPQSAPGPRAFAGGQSDDVGGGFSLDDYDAMGDPAFLAEAGRVADQRIGMGAYGGYIHPFAGLEERTAYRVNNRQQALRDVMNNAAFMRRWMARRAQAASLDPVTGLLRPPTPQPVFGLPPGTLLDPTPPRR